MNTTVIQPTNKVNSKRKSVLEVLETCQELKINVRMIGRWAWTTFSSKPSAEIRTALKEMGFRWVSRRKSWANNFGIPSKPARGYRPEDKYHVVSLEDALASRRAVAI